MATNCQPPYKRKIIVAVSLAWLPVACEVYIIIIIIITIVIIIIIIITISSLFSYVASAVGPTAL